MLSRSIACIRRDDKPGVLLPSTQRLILMPFPNPSTNVLKHSFLIRDCVRAVLMAKHKNTGRAWAWAWLRGFQTLRGDATSSNPSNHESFLRLATYARTLGLFAVHNPAARQPAARDRRTLVLWHSSLPGPARCNRSIDRGRRPPPPPHRPPSQSMPPTPTPSPQSTTSLRAVHPTPITPLPTVHRLSLCFPPHLSPSRSLCPLPSHTALPVVLPLLILLLRVCCD